MFGNQFGVGSSPMGFGHHLGRGNFLTSSRQSSLFNNSRGGGVGMVQMPFGVNQGWWATSPSSVGGQGNPIPGYPPPSYGMQQPYLQQPVALPIYGNPSQAQVREMSTWKTQQGGIKGFISNLIAKWKR